MPRLKGNIAALIAAFTVGAKESGNTVGMFCLQRMDICPCPDCFSDGKTPERLCVQKDDMDKIYRYYKEADIVVLASSIYYWSISGQLKYAIDRLFAGAKRDPRYADFPKDCILRMSAEGADKENFEPVEQYDHWLLRHPGRKDAGMMLAGGVLAAGDIQGKSTLTEARPLGKSIL